MIGRRAGAFACALPAGLSYLLRRLGQLVPTVLAVSLIAFVLIRLSGDPTALLLTPEATEADRRAFRAAHGLDKPLPVQYLVFLKNLLRGDLGTSFWQHEPALRVVLSRFPATLLLASTAIAIVIVAGLAIGVLAAVFRGTALDLFVMAGVGLGQSIATFWLGLMLILTFAVAVPLFPPSGYGTAEQLVLPAVTLAAYYVAVTTRLTRSGMLEILGQDFIRTARAKGLAERVTILRHGLRNALIPITTVLGLQIGELLAGAVVTETVFAWPGVGTLVLDAITRRDYPVVQATIVLIALLYALINLAIDLLYGVLDPRVRTS
jgi:peptide/nickel transport system permease protein